MALNRSRTGATSLSIRRTSLTSANTAPMRNAPKATLKPIFSAKSARPKTNPKTVTSRTSSIRVCPAMRMMRGTSRKPPTATLVKKAVNFTKVPAVTYQPASPVVPRLVRIPMMAMARTSSTIRIPKTTRANSCRISPKPSNVLAIMVVEEMAIMAPKKTLSNFPQPKQCPRDWPKKNMPLISTNAATMATAPTSLSLRRLKCNPTENIKSTTPRSARVLIPCSLETKLKGGVLGPIRIPARRYPRTTGCLSFWQITVATAAAAITNAKS